MSYCARSSLQRLVVGICMFVASARAQAATGSTAAVETSTASREVDAAHEDGADDAEASRLWSATAGGGFAMMSDGGDGVGAMFDATVRPWGRSGIGARVDAGLAGEWLLGPGASHASLLATLGYAHQVPIGRAGLSGSSMDFLVGPMFGVSSRRWSEGLCFDWDGSGCPSSRPEKFESYERAVGGVGGAVSANLHIWYVVFGPYVSAAAGLADGEGLLQLQAGLRLGASDM